MSIENIEKVLAQADEIDLREGKSAYQNYNILMHRIADHYQVGFVQTVAAFVSLSPNNDYVGNLRSLVSVVDGARKGISVERIRTSSYGHCCFRAYDYLIGKKDFLLETQGPKIRNFYCNIIRPEDKRFVTIDGHMNNVWIGYQQTMKEALVGKGIRYNEIADGFKKVARKHDLIPNQLQAIVWFTWKRINNIRYDSQTKLFGCNDDYWGLKLNPEDIRPFRLM